MANETASGRARRADRPIAAAVNRMGGLTRDYDYDYDYAFESVAKANPDNIQEVAAAQLALSTSYYKSVLSQAGRSFSAAIASTVVGLCFFLAAIVLAIIKNTLEASTISALSGGIVEVIAGLNFWLYSKTTAQLDAFHVRLEQTQRYILANSMSRELSGDARDAALSDVIATMVKRVVTRKPSTGPPNKGSGRRLPTPNETQQEQESSKV